MPRMPRCGQLLAYWAGSDKPVKEGIARGSLRKTIARDEHVSKCHVLDFTQILRFRLLWSTLVPTTLPEPAPRHRLPADLPS